MTNTAGYKVTFRLLVLAFLLSAFWVFSGSARKSQRTTEKYIPVVVAGSLIQPGGTRSIEVFCGLARIAVNNQVEFNCKLQNNTSKSITAANVFYSIVMEQGGSEEKDQFSSIIATLGHQQIQEPLKLVQPGGERSIGPSGPISYPDAIIKKVEVEIDLIEFDDGTLIGPDKEGSRLIKDYRQGAAKYREWLSWKFEETGKKFDMVVPLLDLGQPLPVELKFKSQEEQGAKAYRKVLRSMYQSRGSAEVVKILN